MVGRAMATGMRVESNKEDKGGKAMATGNGNKGGGQVTVKATK
jgi:hypothetical protein